MADWCLFQCLRHVSYFLIFPKMSSLTAPRLLRDRAHCRHLTLPTMIGADDSRLSLSGHHIRTSATFLRMETAQAQRAQMGRRVHIRPRCHQLLCVSLILVFVLVADRCRTCSGCNRHCNQHGHQAALRQLCALQADCPHVARLVRCV